MRSVIVFDLDDTLYPEAAYARSGFEEVGAWLVRKQGVRQFAENAWEVFTSGQREHVLERALLQLGVAVDTETLQTMERLYNEHLPRIALHEDAKWALEQFRPTHRLALIADGPLLAARQKVHALGIERAFQALVYSDLYGKDHWKPSPTPYIRVLELVDCRQRDCIFIGDNPATDFATARKLGWYTVQVRRADALSYDVLPDAEQRPHYVLRSLRELPDLL